jgi:hypothetical protein
MTLNNAVSNYDNYGGFDDAGTAARFFYEAKASRHDRDDGLTGTPGKYSHDGRAKPIDNAYQRNASEAINRHATVKPTALMRWCVRLVTPPGGTCLDMYMGSGSTGKAAMLEGFNFIGMELDADGGMLEVATGRILHAQHVLAKMPAGIKRRSTTRRATPPAAGQMALGLEDCAPLPPAPAVARQQVLTPTRNTYAVWCSIRDYGPMLFPPSLRMVPLGVKTWIRLRYKAPAVNGVCKLVPYGVLDRLYIDD